MQQSGFFLIHKVIPPFKKKSSGVFPRIRDFFRRGGLHAKPRKNSVNARYGFLLCFTSHLTLCLGGRADRPMDSGYVFWMVRTLGSFAFAPRKAIGARYGAELFSRRGALDRHATAFLTLPAGEERLSFSLLYLPAFLWSAMRVPCGVTNRFFLHCCAKRNSRYNKYDTTDGVTTAWAKAMN